MKHLNLILKTIAYCTLGLAAFLVLSLLWNSFLLLLARLFGFPETYVSYITWVVLPLLILMPKRFLRVKIPKAIRAEALIDAPIDVVWDAVAPRPRRDMFKRFYAEIRAVDGRDDVFEYVPDQTVAEDMPGVTPLIVARVENDPPYRVSLYHGNEEDQGRLGVGGSVETYALEETPEGTLVRLKEVVEYTSFWLLVTLAVVNPARDTLRSLKHYCEGTRDTSWMAWQMTDHAEHDGEETNVAVWVIGVTACVFLSLVALALVLGVLRFTG